MCPVFAQCVQRLPVCWPPLAKIRPPAAARHCGGWRATVSRLGGGNGPRLSAVAVIGGWDGQSNDNTHGGRRAARTRAEAAVQQQHARLPLRDITCCGGRATSCGAAAVRPNSLYDVRQRAPCVKKCVGCRNRSSSAAAAVEKLRHGGSRAETESAAAAAHRHARRRPRCDREGGGHRTTARGAAAAVAQPH